MTSRLSGRVAASIASRFVQYGVPAKPSMGGMFGAVPVPMTTARVASKTSSPTLTRPGPSSTPQPRTSRPPRPAKRSAAALSFHEAVASSRMREATGVQSGQTWLCPAIPTMRRPSASRLADRIIILLGMQPQ